MTGKKQIQEIEYFEMLRTDDGRFAFRASNNRYITVERNNGGLLVAEKDELHESDLFTMEERRNSLVAFRSNQGKYVSLGQDNSRLLKANASSVGESEQFRILIMKDQVTITKTIEISRSVSVNIGIRNYEEITKHHQGWFVGTIFNWLFPEQAKEKIRKKVKEKLDAKLKSRIEEAINEQLDSRLAEEVTNNIKVELAENKIEATVVTTVK